MPPQPTPRASQNADAEPTHVFPSSVPPSDQEVPTLQVEYDPERFPSLDAHFQKFFQSFCARENVRADIRLRDDASTGDKPGAPPPAAAAQPAPGLGISVAARYRVVEELGRGGMGIVYRAYDGILRRNIAMKVLHKDLRHEHRSTERFLEEAQVASQLQHPNIVPFYEIGINEDSQVYFTMRLVKGRTLTDLLRERKRNPDHPEVTQRRLLLVLQDVCKAVYYAHEKGVVHRDLKPDNIMIGAYGEVFVMDWGVAKLMEALGMDSDESAVLTTRSLMDNITLQGVVVGTPAYMAPEQAQGDMRMVGPHSDIYSLGVILYQILTETLPFRGDDVDAVLERVIHETPKTPRELNRRIPKDLDAICRKAMHRDPRRRYFTALELMNDIDGYFAGLPVSARPPNIIERLRLRLKRRKLELYASLGKVVLAIMVASVAYAIARREFPDTPTPSSHVLIFHVAKDSQAHGLIHPGDILLRYNSHAIKTTEDLTRAMEEAKTLAPHLTVPVTLLRGDERVDIQLKPGRIGIRHRRFDDIPAPD